MKRFLQSVGSEEHGQSLVEMALFMVIFAILLAGVLDLGRFFFTFLSLQDAAGEGATYGAIHPDWITSSDNGDPNNITYRLKNESPSGLIDWTNVTVTVTTSPDSNPGSTITVSAAYNYMLLTPYMGTIVGSQTLPVSADVAAVIITK